MPFDGLNGLDVAAWTITQSEAGAEQTLVMAVQMNYIGRDAVVEFGILDARGTVKQVLFGDVATDAAGRPLFRMKRTDIAAVILELGEE